MLFEIKDKGHYPENLNQRFRLFWVDYLAQLEKNKALTPDDFLAQQPSMAALRDLYNTCKRKEILDLKKLFVNYGTAYQEEAQK